jgi:hypothetical protein
MNEEDIKRELTDFANAASVKGLLDRMEAHYVAQWKATPGDASSQREHLFRMVTAVSSLRNELQHYARATDISAFNNRLKNQQT